ncbi:hypothetical protein J6590_003500 [Homalodisca vitripennis]|nr:hypothetical protein J6590_003500 [Homalodisca vitripennis]
MPLRSLLISPTPTFDGKCLKAAVLCCSKVIPTSSPVFGGHPCPVPTRIPVGSIGPPREYRDRTGKTKKFAHLGGKKDEAHCVGPAEKDLDDRRQNSLDKSLHGERTTEDDESLIFLRTMKRSKSSGLVDNVIAESRRPFSWCVALLYFGVLPLHFSKHQNSTKTNITKQKLNSLLKKTPKIRVPPAISEKTSLEIVPISKISNSIGADQKYKLSCNGKAIMYRAKNLNNHVMPRGLP